MDPYVMKFILSVVLLLTLGWSEHLSDNTYSLLFLNGFKNKFVGFNVHLHWSFTKLYIISNTGCLNLLLSRQLFFSDQVQKTHNQQANV